MQLIFFPMCVMHLAHFELLLNLIKIILKLLLTNNPTFRCCSLRGVDIVVKLVISEYNFIATCLV